MSGSGSSVYGIFKKEETTDFSLLHLTIENNEKPFNKFIARYQLRIEEYIILLLALLPHIQPNFLDSIIQQYLPSGGDFPEIGGVKGSNYRGTLPTGETALFILAGNDVKKMIT